MTGIDVAGRTVEISRPDKVLFPEGGQTKLDLARYHERVAPLMLPHLADRPLVVQRYPDGVGEEGFYQKEVPEHYPDWIRRVELPKQDGTVTQVVADDAATLVYLADQACITVHVFCSRADRIRAPDQIVFDLDPSTDDLGRIRSGAALVRGVLAEVGVTSFVKTSGSRGLHVHVPLDRSADYDEARALAREVADVAARRDPDRLTTEQRKDERGDRVFLDVLRNAYGQHVVAPYSVRARPDAPVAVPLDWGEATSADFRPRRYTLENVFRRLAQKDDPWDGFARHAVSVAAVRDRLRRPSD